MRIAKRILLYGALPLVSLVAILVGYFCYSILDATESLPWSHPNRGVVQRTVVSRDGATISFTQGGSGSSIILVGAALADHTGTSKLARLLRSRFTVLNYDRRGRGASTDHQPYAVAREVEDIEAMVNAAGGSAYLFGSSSGAVLALDAANSLGSKVTGLVIYEPPFIVDASRPPMPGDLTQQIRQQNSAGQYDDAVKAFFTEGMGIPPLFVNAMRWMMPGWSSMAGMAQTIPNDLAVLAGTQDGKPLPVDRWKNLPAPVLILVGSRSEPFFHSGAKSLASLLPRAEYRSLPNRDHSAVLMAPQDLAAEISRYLLNPSSSRRQHP